MSTRKRAGLDARDAAISAAVVAAAPDSSRWDGEATKAISLRLPYSLYKRVTQHSLDLRLARGADKKKDREASDPLSMHGLILTALAEYLDREAPE